MSRSVGLHKLPQLLRGSQCIGVALNGFEFPHVIWQFLHGYLLVTTVHSYRAPRYHPAKTAQSGGYSAGR